MDLNELKTFSFLSGVPVGIKLPDCYAMLWQDVIVPVEFSLLLTFQIFGAKFPHAYVLMASKNNYNIEKHGHVNNKGHIISKLTKLKNNGLTLQEIVTLHLRSQSHNI